MKKLTTTIFTLLALGALNAQTIESPSKQVKVNFELTANGQPSYSVTYKGKEIVKPSTLGFVLKDAEALENGFTVTNYTTKSVNDAWQPVLGEYKEIKDIHNEGTFQLTQTSTNRNVNVTFRVFDEGVAFRYEFPKQQNLNYFIVKEEKTQFNLTGDHQTFWLPGDFDTQEYTYIESKISGIDHSKIDMNNGIG
ncbi:MAG: glycoside hydrolase family 97 N-terminal domain-containing protein, partial [Flavobacteriaceae bacterium]|nr:glycoside hydrolase family 97 N-terminal domain-containing protein [Candidatus Onthonaster equi]